MASHQSSWRWFGIPQLSQQLQVGSVRLGQCLLQGQLPPERDSSRHLRQPRNSVRNYAAICLHWEVTATNCWFEVSLSLRDLRLQLAPVPMDYLKVELETSGQVLHCPGVSRRGVGGRFLGWKYPDTGIEANEVNS